jgi:hypothetical protein
MSKTFDLMIFRFEKCFRSVVSWYNDSANHLRKYGDVMVSTGMWKQDKRAAVCPVCVKKGTLNTNAKNNNKLAFAA